MVVIFVRRLYHRIGHNCCVWLGFVHLVIIIREYETCVGRRVKHLRAGEQVTRRWPVLINALTKRVNMFSLVFKTEIENFIERELQCFMSRLHSMPNKRTDMTREYWSDRIGTARHGIKLSIKHKDVWLARTRQFASNCGSAICR